jgi:plasmid stability protein
MDKFIKRLQTRASRKGISVSKSQVREVYTQVVVEPDSPTDEEIVFVIEQDCNRIQSPLESSTGLPRIWERINGLQDLHHL